MIVRISRASVREGQEESFERFIRERGVPLVRKQKGIREIVHGWELVGDGRVYFFVSVWETLEDVQRFAGPNWRNSVVLPEEDKLVVEMTCEHYETLGAGAPPIPA